VSGGSIYLKVPGVPIAQPRHRATAIGGRARMYLPTSAPVNTYKAAIQLAWHAAGEPRLDGPLAVSIDFVFPRPKSKTKKRGDNPRFWHVSKPDLDNLYKATLDAMNGLAFHDDSQVSSCRVRKIVAAAGEAPYTEIELCNCP